MVHPEMGQRDRVDLDPCRKCCGEMQEILSIAPTMREPGPVGRLAVIAGKALGCGKNGTRGAIFHKRRLLGEYILAVCKAGIWRMSDEMKAHAPKLIIQ